MKAIIIAAGRAPRLLPLTKDNPQCLLKIKDKTILEKQVESLNKSGIRDIVVVVGYYADKIEGLCKKLRIKTVLNPFYNVSGMAMTLWTAKEELKEGFIFLYSDILFEEKVVKELVKNKGDVCLVIKRDGLREEAEKVVEKNGFIERITKAEAEGENGEFIGLAKFSKNGAERLIQELNKIAKVNINAPFIEIMENIIKSGEKVSAYDIKDSKFIDIDFPEDLEKAKNF